MTSPRTPKALIVAAPRSGAGKTTVVLGLLAALKRQGVAVRSAKCGPDYIDGAFHAALTGHPCLNLDGWAMSPALLEDTLQAAGEGADLLLIEAAMGLFDGAAVGGPVAKGSAAELAVRFGVPVLLVLDVAAQAQSAAAELHGFASFDPRLDLAGVIVNRFGGERHRDLLARAIAPLDIPLAGSLPRDPAMRLPERHLGLVQAREQRDLTARIDHLADKIEQHCDLDLIRSLARPLTAQSQAASALPPPGQRIALAHDAAFSFVYPHLIQGWRKAGAEIVLFSPLADEAPSAECDACWLPGGYPELHAGRLAGAQRFKQGLAAFAEARPVHGECGGYMMLGEALIDAQGCSHAMAGLLSHVTSFAERRLHLGYRSAALLHDGALGPAGSRLRGHEFHYASLIEPGRDEAFADLADAEGKALGPAGGRRGGVTGSFFHTIAFADASISSVARHEMEHA